MEKFNFVTLVCSLLLIEAFTEDTEDYFFCANSRGSIAHIAEDGGPENIPTEVFQKCRSKYCYTLWQEHTNGSLQVMAQGEWFHI